MRHTKALLNHNSSLVIGTAPLWTQQTRRQSGVSEFNEDQ